MRYEKIVVRRIEIDSEIFNQENVTRVTVKGLSNDGNPANFNGDAVHLASGGCLIYVPAIQVEHLLKVL